MFYESATTSSYSCSTASCSSSRTGGGDAMPSASEPFNPVLHEQAMWRAVIVQALMDAACGSGKYEAMQARNEALIWLRGMSRDFATVCYYAGFEPDYVRLMVKNALTNNCRWRALPGEGTRRRPTRKPSRKKAGQRR